MKKIVLLFWGKKGNVERAARKVYAKFDPAIIDIFDVVSFDVSKIKDYQLLILCGSTIGAENWQDVKDDNEWNRFFVKIRKYDLSKTKVASIGLGDQVLYPGHFVDGLAVFKEEMERVGAKMIGYWPTKGYDFTDSDGMEDDMFYGLALDLDRQDELTDERIDKWTKQVKAEAGL
ncbi:MAG TPA: flavodoxin domain-containing protein [Bacteroidales bacterium]